MTQTSEHPLIPAERVNGTTVYGQDGAKVGKIEDIAIDKQSGRVAYAILGFGGVLGLGERYLPLPWSVLTYDTDKNGYVTPLGPEALKEAPSFEPGELSGWSDTHMRDRVFDYYAAYGAAPYWI